VSRSRLRPVLYAALLTGLLTLLFWDRIVAMVQLWIMDGTYSLFALVPLVSLLVAYSRLRTGASTGQTSRAGLVIAAVAIAATALLGIMQIGFSLTPLLLALTLSGIVLGLYGSQMLRTLAFPLALLLLLIPVPPPLLASIDFPLQVMCAKVTVFIVNLAGFHVQRAGTMILLGPASLAANVAPACDGVRSSLAMLFLATMYVYLLAGNWRQRSRPPGDHRPYRPPTACGDSTRDRIKDREVRTERWHSRPRPGSGSRTRTAASSPRATAH